MRATDRDKSYEELLRASEERLRLGEIAGGIITFECDYNGRVWNWSARKRLRFLAQIMRRPMVGKRSYSPTMCEKSKPRWRRLGWAETSMWSFEPSIMTKVSIGS